jgi:hypothetical protein
LVLEKNTGNIVESLKYILESKLANIDWIINPVTTIPDFLAPKDSILIESKKRKSGGWSFLNLNNKYPIFISRNLNDSKTSGNAFTGIFRISLEKLKKTVKEIKADDLIFVVDSLYKKYSINIRKVKWFDIGHSVNYWDTKSRLVSSRHFNKISIDLIKGVVIKKSSQIQKIKSQSNYVKRLPEDLKILFPRQNEKVSIENGFAIQKMEYYAYPTLAEIYIYWQIDYVKWERIFDSLYFIIQEFVKYPSKISFTEHQTFYSKKTFSRVRDFFIQVEDFYPEFKNNQEIFVNGKLLKNIHLLTPWINEYINKMFRPKENCLMHGDFCFNNIIYDPYGGTIRLIDPRGQMTNSGNIHSGDLKYDIAKLIHSSVYGYDLIVSGYYEINRENKNFTYKIFFGKNHEILKKLSEEFIKKFDIPIMDINFIVATLFLSMASLHSDDKKRQTLMFLHGLTLINSIYDTQSKIQ